MNGKADYVGEALVSKKLEYVVENVTNVDDFKAAGGKFCATISNIPVTAFDVVRFEL